MTEHSSLAKMRGIACLASGDCLELLRLHEAGDIDLVITSPPYNIGKVYESRLDIEEYMSWMSLVIGELHRVLRDGGSICWQVGNYVRGNVFMPLDYLFYEIFQKQGFTLRNRIIWHYRHGLNCQSRLSGRYETVCWWTKGDNYTFNLDDIRVPQRYPGKRSYRNGPKKGSPSGNPKGKNPSDVWELLQDEFDMGLFDVPNVKANHCEKTSHPCQFPIEIAERCVLAFSSAGNVVLDPFCGSGSAVLAALIHDRLAVGFDLSNEYVDLAVDRVNRLNEGCLRYRPAGTKVGRATGRVSRVPAEWQSSA